MQEMSDMPKGHCTIEVQASCILESRKHGCTIFLIDAADSWHKFYGSTREALHEARILKLSNSTLIRLAGGNASSNEPPPICVVDLAKIVELEFHKG
jgi:predicted metalloprotease